uniref:N-acetyltransferase domain-containing protein n=1 Tax=Corethron hystrix TaxID=216773 RepID=A0A7S1B368_9STRA|mmetsp:Transcript_10272/g.22800  ORF Transcript_10272/g.22800 Transcript_10272/m.22800 type:complete len:291 (+) Transcript_10272:166-1038(+)|eukprot:CAMPEP_0113311374 /NCGR_PEP_ID=MMETSP0010_2-20120614/8638_1 /TAXON_ID=216773 ORGANISM="Corethron hystrix, Strain 308" /NCGR_SAMPLE_ID=MMETSP0010_2 /ASSEMBLY_ACC=CAM_ASM_000155 /LENGTH=290 /DNA_ID=CAMNT_0000167003 /DNA_START=117 /DNA_END=989 /DNA_ORIENTATION=- /assembly_acc=CAM_ASM_000155
MHQNNLLLFFLSFSVIWIDKARSFYQSGSPETRLHITNKNKCVPQKLIDQQPRTIDSIQLSAINFGSLSFGTKRPLKVTFQPLDGNSEVEVREIAKFFTDAFWAGKVGGAKTLTSAQAISLERQQSREFRSRYGTRVGGWGGEDRALVVARDDDLDVPMGCAGIQIDSIRDIRLQRKGQRTADMIIAPLMSNVAVGPSYRRMGIAEDLVKKTEELALNWGYKECYLLVEKRNVPAVKLYRKLGYRPLWEDKEASTLVPQSNGSVANELTTLVCMMKKVRGLGSFFNFFPF